MIVFGVLNGGVIIKKINNIILISIILCIFLTIGTVAATENTTLNFNNNQTNNITTNNSTLTQNNNINTLTATENNEVSTVYQQSNAENVLQNATVTTNNNVKPTLSVNTTNESGINSAPGMEVFLNESFSFNLKFNVANDSDVGWDPAIEIFVPSNITLTDATFLGNNVEIVKVGTFNSNGTGVNDPYTKTPINNANYANYTLYTLSYPLGSFTKGTDGAVMNIKALLNGNATVGLTQLIYATPLFKYTNSSDLSQLSPVYGANVTGYIDPIVMTVDKNTIVHDWETATGINYPFPYYVDVDIANGKTVYNITVNDTIPNQLKFLNISSIVINGNNITDFSETNLKNYGIIITSPDINYTGGNLVVKFDNLTGTTSKSDVRIWFNVYAPEFDNNTIKGTNLTILNNNTGASNLTVNNVTATGTYNNLNVTDKSSIEVTLRSLAIQKHADNYSWGSEIPLNSNLNYTAYFQVSDYFDIGNMTILDVFGTIKTDGTAQVFNASQPVILTITVQNQTYTYTLTQENGGYALVNHTDMGTQDVFFNIGKFLTNNTVKNITNLTGGLYSSRSTNAGYAVGTLKFGVIIKDKYINTTTNGTNVVNGGDSIYNSVYMNGTLYNTTNIISDTGGTYLVVATPTINKTVYAVNGNTSYKNNSLYYNSTNNDTLIHSGDNVTYMLNITIPSGSEKGLNITDSLPIPFYNATQFIVSVGNGTNTTSVSIPLAGHWAYTSDSDILTDNNSVNINPEFTYDDSSNLIKWMFGDTYSKGTTRTLIILYTVTATNAIVPDCIYKTNRVMLSYYNTELSYNSNQNIYKNISQVYTQYPSLNINKTVNTTNSVVNGTNVTYTIIVNNTGHGAAFNVTLLDNFNSLNISDNNTVIGSLKITYANGTEYTLNEDDKKSFFNGTGLHIASIPSLTYLNITYEVVFNDNLVPNSVYVNTANITSYYAGTSENATNYVNGTNTDYYSSAEVKTLSLNFTKSYEGSNDTANSLKNLTIGETGIWYLNVTLPKNLNVTNLSIIDTLPVGFKYTNLTINTTSTELAEFLKDYTISISNNKVNITFTKSIYSTSSNENFTIILYSVVTSNSTATYNKTNYTTVTNNANLYWYDGNANHTISKSATVVVTQPSLNVTKSFNPTTLINDYSNVTIIIKNNGSSTAYNVTVYDNMAAEDSDFNETDWNATVYYPNGTTSIITINNGILSFDAGNLTPGQNITIKYNMTLKNFAFLEGLKYNNTVIANYYSMNDTFPYRANYTVNASAILNTDLTTISKTLTNTSFNTTNGNNLTIGENGTFNITVVLARGTYQNLTISDTLPTGMVLVPGSIKIISVADNFIATLNNITTISTGNTSFSILFYTNSTNNYTQSTVMDNNLTITYEAIVTNASTNTNGKSLTNNATVNWTAVPTGHTNTTTITVVEPNLGINKTANVTNLTIGDNFTYNITIFHNSTSRANATNVTIKDTLPDGIYFTNITNYTTSNGVKVNFTDNKTVVITMDNLALGSVESIILQTGVENNTAYAGKNITNIVNLTYTDTTGNRTYNTTNNTKVHVINVDLVINKTNSTTVVAGKNVTYTITVKNNGPDTAYNVTVNDLLPTLLENVTIKSGSTTGTVTDHVASIVLGTLTNGQSVTITVTGFIPANTTVDNITNFANVTTTTT
ncbi:MAG: DUF11 domain-containing protein, partial [Methanobacteriaceae archaeon]|nr:DUF11 domain-containing protein [Methanobacteriaceae archaeon]